MSDFSEGKCNLLLWAEIVILYLKMKINICTYLLGVFACTAMLTGFAYAQSYQDIQIVSPKADTTIHNNNGNLTVTVVVSPSLDSHGSAYLVLLLDGKVVAKGTKQYFKLTEIDRGMHTLQAQLKAQDDTTLITSQVVRFYMWHASRLYPQRKN